MCPARVLSGRRQGRPHWLMVLDCRLVSFAQPDGMAFHYYPFGGRLLLFLLPVFALMVADTVKPVERHSQRADGIITAILLLATMTALSLPESLDIIRSTTCGRSRRNRCPGCAGDQLSVSAFATPCFLYYADNTHFRVAFRCTLSNWMSIPFCQAGVTGFS